MLRRQLSQDGIRWWAAIGLVWAVTTTFWVHGATVTWKTAVNGNWDDGSKWSTGAMPAPGDTVVITAAGTYTVTVNVAASPAALTVNAATGIATLAVNGGSLTVNGPGTVGPGGHLRLDSGTLAGSGDITTPKFTWSGGQIEGAGKLIFPAAAVVDVVNGAPHYLRDRTVVNGGTVNWPSETATYVGFGTVWLNQLSSVLELKADAQIYS